MGQIFSCAQKFLIVDIKNLSNIKILVSKYLDSKYLSEKLTNKYCLLGGQFEFGQSIEDNAYKEVMEEANVEIIPSTLLDIWTWVYEKDENQKQIVAVSRIGIYKRGKPSLPKEQKETKLAEPSWIDLKKLQELYNSKKYVVDELPSVKKFLELAKNKSFFKSLN